MIRENIQDITRRIESSRIKAPGSAAVTLVAVSKGRTVKEIEEALAAGITDIGENRVQEAVLKHSAVRATPYAVRAKWHMVGHLQTNKVKDAVRIFDLIHSLDSMRLAQEIDRQAAKIDKIQDVLVEVKTSPEATKYGMQPQDVPEFVRAVAPLKNMRVLGLMTIAPIVEDAEQSRPYFKRVRVLFDEINALHATPYALRILSMGMTDDFEIAIEEGSNMVRLGRAIFD